MRLRALGIASDGTPPNRIRVDMGTPTISALVPRPQSSSTGVLDHMEKVFGQISYLEQDLNDTNDVDFHYLPAPHDESSTDNMNISDDFSTTTLQKLVNDQAFLNWLTEDDRDTLSFEVRRSRVFNDAMRTMRFMRKEDVDKPLRVTFKFEPGVDDGGLRREFASLFFRGLIQSSMLVGPCNAKTFAHDGTLLQTKSFLHLGQLFSMTILQGGFGFPCFCKPVADYILSGDAKFADIDDVPQQSVAEALKQIAKIRTTSELVDSIDDILPDRFDWGFRKPTYLLTLSDVDVIINTVAMHHSFWICKAELDQFCEGLNLFEVRSMMKSHQKLCRPLLQHGSYELTMDTIEQLFDVNYTPDAGNKQDFEKGIMMNWKFFLLSIRNGDCKLAVNSGSSNVVVEFKDVLRFATGAEAVPAGGFVERPCIMFDHSSSAVGRLPTANTCSCRMTFPVWEGLYGENEKVAIDLFTRAIVEGQTFGSV